MNVTAAAERELILDVLRHRGAASSATSLQASWLVATLTGTALGRDVHGTLDTEYVADKGDVFITIDPAALAGEPARPAVSGYLDLVRATPRQDEAGPVRVPGDRARADRCRRLSAGIEVPDEVWQAAVALAQRNGTANE